MGIPNEAETQRQKWKRWQAKRRYGHVKDEPDEWALAMRRQIMTEMFHDWQTKMSGAACRHTKAELYQMLAEKERS